jgi:hypothetical protein
LVAPFFCLSDLKLSPMRRIKLVSPEYRMSNKEFRTEEVILKIRQEGGRAYVYESQSGIEVVLFP